MTTADPCKYLACKLQKCLKDNVYQPSLCEKVIEELRQCCVKNAKDSVVCDGIDTSKKYEHNTVDYKGYKVDNEPERLQGWINENSTRFVVFNEALRLGAFLKKKFRHSVYH